MSAVERVRQLFELAAVEVDAIEHARMLRDALGIILERQGVITNNQRDALLQAGQRALQKTEALLGTSGLGGIRLEVGVLGARHALDVWAMPVRDRERLRGKDVLDALDYAAVLRNDLDSTCHILAARRRDDRPVGSATTYH